MESNTLKEYVENELKLIQVKDKLFDTFSSFLNNEIRLKIRQEHNSCLTKVRNWFTEIMPTVYESNMLAAVEEEWAMFLRRLDNGDIKLEEAEEKCKALINQLRNDFQNHNLIKNPYYFTCIAYDTIIEWSMIEWLNIDSPKAVKALDYFKKAIEIEEKKSR